MGMRILAGLAAAAALAACNSQPSVEAENVSGAEVLNELEASGAAAEAKLEPGRWRVSARVADVQVAGLAPEMAQAFEAMKARTTASEMCVRPEDAAKPDPKMFGADHPESCTFESFKMGGGTLKSVMRCTPPEGGQLVVRTDGTYSPLAYKVRTAIEGEAQMGDRAEKLTMVTEVAGERIGPCEAPAAKKGG